MKTAVAAALVAALGGAAFAGSASASTNLLQNGSFETGTFADWTLSGTTGDAYPEVVVPYGSSAQYPNGAFGEPVPPATGSLSPDPAGNYAAYFVSDFANETLSQSVFLTPGLYSVGFSVYAPANGYSNVGNATFTGSVGGVDLADFTVSSQPADKWINITGVADITTAGDYLTSFTFNTDEFPSKDLIVDQAYIVGVPEPAAWIMMIVGLFTLGAALRLARSRDQGGAFLSSAI